MGDAIPVHQGGAVKIYTALLKPDAEPVLVREGFAWGALFFGPLWLAAHRAWIAAAISLAAYILIAVLPRAGEADPDCGPCADPRASPARTCDAGRWNDAATCWRMCLPPATGTTLHAAAGLRPDLAARYRPEPSLMHIAVVDYGSGNLASASRALALAAERAGIAATVAVTADPAVGGSR